MLIFSWDSRGAAAGYTTPAEVKKTPAKGNVEKVSQEYTIAG